MALVSCEGIPFAGCFPGAVVVRAAEKLFSSTYFNQKPIASLALAICEAIPFAGCFPGAVVARAAGGVSLEIPDLWSPGFVSLEMLSWDLVLDLVLHLVLGARPFGFAFMLLGTPTKSY